MAGGGPEESEFSLRARARLVVDPAWGHEAASGYTAIFECTLICMASSNFLSFQCQLIVFAFFN
jgi:hypothetical protein